MSAGCESPRLRRLVACATLWLHVAAGAGAQTTLSVAADQCADGQCQIDGGASPADVPRMPLLQYHKPDGVTPNPLRPQAPPTVIAPSTTAVPPYGAAAAPLGDAPRFDARVQPAVATEPVAASDYLSDTPPTVTPPSATSPSAASTASPPLPLASYDADDRRLAPPSSEQPSGDNPRRSSRAQTSLSAVFAKLKSLSSAGGGLALVIGLLVASVWLLRRSGPKPSGVLPPEAFAVLGRAPLTAQSFAQLLRIGNKLVLVAMSADGAQPLAEVTDPAEVDRIAGLCVSGRPGGSSAEFQQVLAQLSREPARGFLGRESAAARRR